MVMSSEEESIPSAVCLSGSSLHATDDSIRGTCDLDLEICSVICTHNISCALDIKMPPKSGKKGGTTDKGKNAAEEERPDPLQALVCLSLSDVKKSAESCVYNKEVNICNTELTHVNYRSWPTLSSPSSSLSHSKSHDAFCHWPIRH
jgi:hypothetical protein